jgi:glycyl-tRNA synthetase
MAQARLNWHKSMGVRPENLRARHIPKINSRTMPGLQPISSTNIPIGWQEVEGIHNRTDFDLSRTRNIPARKMEYYDQKLAETIHSVRS